MTNSLLTTLLNMKQLNKYESIAFLFGGLLMVTGAGLYAFFLIQPVSCWVMLVGAIIFVLMQTRQRYTGTQLTIRRLRKIMTFAGIGFILAGLFMVEDWVILLLISAVLEMYTTHRINYELRKESPLEG